MSYSEEEKRWIRENGATCGTYRKTPELAATPAPSAETLLGETAPTEEAEPETPIDLDKAEPETPADSVDTEPERQEEPQAPAATDAETQSSISVPVTLEEPGIILLYKTRKSEAATVRIGVIEELIKERIDSMPLPFGTAGTPYDQAIDLLSKDISDNFGSIEILGINVTDKLAALGLTCQKENNTTLRLSGTPTEEFDGKLFFFLVHPDYEKELPRSPEESKSKFQSFTGYPKQYVHSRVFQINADPKSLWQDLPVEDYEGYENKDNDDDGREIVYVPEKKAGFLTSAVPARSLEVVAASRRGRSHAHAAKPRDDCFYYEIDEETGWNFVAVADGAGSARYSRKGSEIACKTIVEKLHKQLNAEYDAMLVKDAAFQFVSSKAEYVKAGAQWDEEHLQSFLKSTKLDQIFHIAVDATIRAIHEEKKARENATHETVAVKDYHTTLLCVAFKYFGHAKSEREIGGWLVASYWVGDGGAAILRWNDTDRVLVLGEPDGGEFAGQTRFLTIPDEIKEETIKKRLRFHFCDTFEAILLVTDGITDPFFPSEAAVVDEHRWRDFYEQKLRKGCEEEPDGCPDLFDPLKTPKEKSRSLLKWLDFWSKGNHDDRTILVVKPK